MAQPSSRVVQKEFLIKDKTPFIMKENLTPLMKQYEELKSLHTNEVLLFRLGDFYEMFGEDAKMSAPILEVALTHRQGVPMCGIPHHAVERYIPKLLKNGLRIAIAEQMEDPSTTKGIVKREVIRVISAGTVVEEKLLNEKSNNFLVALAFEEPDLKLKDNQKDLSIALAVLDISTGQFSLMEIQSGQNFSNLLNELSRMNPAEILLCQESDFPFSLLNGIPLQFLKKSDFYSFNLEKLFSLSSNSWLFNRFKDHPLSAEAARMVLTYTQKVNPTTLQNIQMPEWIFHSDVMTMDKETIENLEILKNSFDGTTEKTLLSFLDRTLTPMGGRLLKHWLVRPLIQIEKIKERIQTVDFFFLESVKRKNCRETLKGISDLERIVGRIASGQTNPRDLIGLKLSLLKIEKLKGLFFQRDSSPLVEELLLQIEDGSDLINLIESAIADEPPIYLENGGAIRSGYDPSLDEKRKAAEEGKSWLESLEKREKEKTGISTLKIGYTSVFGYYLEVTKPHLSKVPLNWVRKQTLINVERFINEELKELEQKILGAEEQSLRIERTLFQKILQSVKERSEGIQKTARAVAALDCFISLAEVAEIKSLSKPQVDTSRILSIVDGWHPVVKEYLPTGSFVPNNTYLDDGKNQIVILTGPNMSGKSVYLRQVALIVLMAQIGSFVPAKEVRIGVVDRIFTRIGSGDRLAQGESTFMVEMNETARILNDATEKSFIILDEVGRGTSTYDGISIAWAVIEHLAKNKNPKVLFATHYFELTHLANEMDCVKNYSVETKEWQDSLLFLHKIVLGPADRSYGIHVAKLAGLPPEVVERAKKILNQLEQKDLSLLELNQGIQPQELFSFPIPR